VIVSTKASLPYLSYRNKDSEQSPSFAARSMEILITPP